MTRKSHLTLSFSLSFLGIVFLLNNPSFSFTAGKSAGDINDDADYSESFRKSILETASNTKKCGRITPPRQRRNKSNTYSIMNFSTEVETLKGNIEKTNALVDSYQDKIPGLLKRKEALNGKVTYRTKVAFNNLVNDTVTLIQNEGSKVRRVPYVKNGGSATEDITAYQMQANCSIQGLITVETMLLSDQDNPVCRKVLENYYPKEDVVVENTNKLTSTFNWMIDSLKSFFN